MIDTIMGVGEVVAWMQGREVNDWNLNVLVEEAISSAVRGRTSPPPA
jgi:hypothetical protein